jgi:hypothetical protein
VVFLFSTTLFCQEFTGHVTDPSHAAVPKATITVHNQGTNTDVTTLTTGAGKARPTLCSMSIRRPPSTLS